MPRATRKAPLQAIPEDDQVEEEGPVPEVLALIDGLERNGKRVRVLVAAAYSSH